MDEPTEKTPPSEGQVLIVPLMGSLPVRDGVPVRDGEDVQLMLRNVTDDAGEEHLVLLAFSTVDALVDGMGEAQPWAAVPAAALGPALEGSGAETVLIDPVLIDPVPADG